MILWTIQHENVYKILMETGFYSVNESYINLDWFGEAYLWLSDKMKEKIGFKPDNVTYPVWAWYRCFNKTKDITLENLLANSCHNNDSCYYCIKLEVPDELVVLSDFDYWHCVLNKEYIATCDEDYNRFWGMADIVNSWDRVFDIECTFDNEEHSQLTTQATMWFLKKEWVLLAEPISKNTNK